ncbi:MAG: hypothetical protein ACOCVZ_06890, partial [Gemmatimonadota bacterium]
MNLQQIPVLCEPTGGTREGREGFACVRVKGEPAGPARKWPAARANGRLSRQMAAALRAVANGPLRG